MEDDNKMFCYQCEQTAGGTGCTVRGVCGKTAEIAGAQDALTEALVSLAWAVRQTGSEPTEAQVDRLVDGLFTCVTNVSFDARDARSRERRVVDEGNRVPGFATARTFRLQTVWREPSATRSLKSLLLFGLRGLAAYAHHAAVLGYHDRQVDAFFVEGLAALADRRTADELLHLAVRLGEVTWDCLALLDRAQTNAFGRPSPARVSRVVAPGPFVVVTGHDLLDLDNLLVQADETDVNVYTHGEMLPAHGYPNLRSHRRLRGHFGTAWQNQQKEFDGIPAPILWTTNCLMPPRFSYVDRVWTTGPVHYPGVHVVPQVHGRKDFAGLLAQARELHGWPAAHSLPGLNGGTGPLVTGFGHDYLLSQLDRLAAAVRKGRIRHFYLVGGCDGAHLQRSVYTDFVRRLPADTVFLTLACGKFRFNDLDLGEIDGLPRLLDLGQCNDAYGALRVVQGLARAFACDANDLPLTIVLSWYEQKAVAVLLMLLARGVRNIRLGPTPPAFLAADIRKALTEAFGLQFLAP